MEEAGLADSAAVTDGASGQPRAPYTLGIIQLMVLLFLEWESERMIPSELPTPGKSVQPSNPLGVGHGLSSRGSWCPSCRSLSRQPADYLAGCGGVTAITT